MKEIKMKKETRYSSIALVFNAIALILFIGSFFIPNREIGKNVSLFGWMCLVGALTFETMSQGYAIMYLKEDIGNISYAINTLAENVREELYGTDEEETPEDSAALQDEVPEAETKETMIVSPEDFERFQKGEMTKEELLGIKKAVDTVVEAKMKSN